MSFHRVLFRHKWPVVVPMYQLRECPECFALVCKSAGQRGHEEWHELARSELEDRPLTGYVVGMDATPDQGDGE